MRQTKESDSMSTKEFQLVNSDCVPMTIEIATEFRDMEASPTERELDPRRVVHLRKKAEAGQLVTFHWASAEVDGKEVRMNGQHSSTMLADLNGDFPQELYVHLDRYKVRDRKALALLFRQFDDKKSSRTPSDVSGAYQGLFSDLSDVPKATAKLGIEAIVWHHKQIEGTPVPAGDSVYEWFDRAQHYPFLIWLGELLTRKTPEMKKKELVAAMYATFDASEVKAKEFWKFVAAGGKDFDDAHPAAMLDTWLLSIKDITDSSKRPKPANYYQAGVYAFNAFCDDRQLKKINTKTDKGWYEPIV